MAAQWGNNSLAPGSSAGWLFARANTEGFLPVLQVMPLTPSFTNPSGWNLTSGGYPYENQLGISTVWSQLSDDLSTVLWLMVVQNNSNNTVEYAFLEADRGGPANATPPSAGLGSNSNYFLYSPAGSGQGISGCNPLIGLTVTINVAVDIAGSDGFGFQINAYSGSGDFDGAQQYVIIMNPQGQVFAGMDNWQNGSTQIINNFPSLMNLSGAKLPAGYTLTIALQNDDNGNITGATYTVVDNHGDTAGNVNISLLSLSQVGGGPVTAADLAPIVAFQLNFVDWANGGTTKLSSGAGSITYTASTPMTITDTEPACVDWNYATVEAANSIYGPMPEGSNTTFTQSFAVGPPTQMIHKKATVLHALRKRA
jgi:hypothetical protein